MSAFMKTAAAAGATYAANPDVVIPFEPSYMYLSVTSTTNAYFSFDGVNDHGFLRGGTNQTQNLNLMVRTRATKVWLRQDSGAVTGIVMAYTDN